MVVLELVVVPELEQPTRATTAAALTSVAARLERVATTALCPTERGCRNMVVLPIRR